VPVMAMSWDCRSAVTLFMPRPCVRRETLPKGSSSRTIDLIQRSRYIFDAVLTAQRDSESGLVSRYYSAKLLGCDSPLILGGWNQLTFGGFTPYLEWRDRHGGHALWICSCCSARAASNLISMFVMLTPPRSVALKSAAETFGEAKK
jgi:hypothetical protein